MNDTKKLFTIGIIAILYISLVGCSAVKQMPSDKPLVIAHRGASGYLPEHTLEAATLAYAQGADYIEQDLIATKDNELVVLHDIHLETVTDVEQKFPQRIRKDGRYYALDFTLAELKTLRVHERQTTKGKDVFANRYQGTGHFQIATFEEQIELVQQLNRQLGKNVGLYPEIKSPQWHQKNGVDISQLVLNVLRKYGLDSPTEAIFVQCFDFSETQRLRTKLGAKVKLVQLIAENDWHESSTDYDYLKSPTGLAEIAKVAQGVGPWIPQLVDLKTLKPTEFMHHAHAVGLLVHPFTFRKDALPPSLKLQQTLEILFEDLEIDGLFTDFSDTVVNYLTR